MKHETGGKLFTEDTSYGWADCPPARDQDQGQERRANRCEHSGRQIARGVTGVPCEMVAASAALGIFKSCSAQRAAIAGGTT